MHALRVVLCVGVSNRQTNLSIPYLFCSVNTIILALIKGYSILFYIIPFHSINTFILAMIKGYLQLAT